MVLWPSRVCSTSRDDTHQRFYTWSRARVFRLHLSLNSGVRLPVSHLSRLDTALATPKKVLKEICAE